MMDCPCAKFDDFSFSRLGFKVGFHYPSSRAELTARELGCIF